MPINTLKQAAIDGSRAQWAAVAEIASRPGVVFARVEETNIHNMLAVTTKRGTSVVAYDGTITAVAPGGRGA